MKERETDGLRGLATAFANATYPMRDSLEIMQLRLKEYWGDVPEGCERPLVAAEMWAEQAAYALRMLGDNLTQMEGKSR